MDNLNRGSKHWKFQQIIAPWRSVALTNATPEDTAAERAERYDTILKEVASNYQSLDELWTSPAVDMLASFEEVITRSARRKHAALETQVQGLQTELRDSSKSRSTAENSLESCRQEREKLLARIQDQSSRIEAALTDPRPGDVSQEHLTKLEKELDETKDSLKRVRLERDELKRSLRVIRKDAMHDDSRAEDLRAVEAQLRRSLTREKDEALQQQKVEAEKKAAFETLRKETKTSLKTRLQEQALELQDELRRRMEQQEEKLDEEFQQQVTKLEKDFSSKMQTASEEQTETFNAEKAQIVQALRKELETNKHDAAIRLASADRTLCVVSNGLERAAAAFGIRFPVQYGLGERASKIAGWGILRVSQGYRKAIERVCNMLDIELHAWPAIGDEQHYEQLENILDEFVQGVNTQFQTQHDFWLSNMQTVLNDARSDIRHLESVIDEDKRLSNHVRSHIELLDGPDGLIENFIQLLNESVRVLGGQDAVITKLKDRLRIKEELCKDLAQVLEEIMAVGN